MKNIFILMSVHIGLFLISCSAVASEVGDAQNESRPMTSAEINTILPDPKTINLTGGMFNRLWSDPPTLDPHLCSDTTSSGIVVEVFGGLVSFDTSLNIIPDIAESWDISENGQVYTFFLRNNAVFHDGKKVTAADFKWSFERAANPETASSVAETYLGDIKGVANVLSGKTTEITGIRVLDDATLEIEIDAPKAYFLAKLTYPTAYVLDQYNVETGGRNWTDNPNGTGPFKLIDYKIGERIILQRHDLYHLEPAKLFKIQMNLAGGSSMAMYENDEIDITGIGMLDLERIKDPIDPLNSDLVIGNPGFSISYIGFNSEIEPFDDAKFRKALTYAIDKEMIAREIYTDLVIPAYGILPPGFPGFNRELKGLKYNEILARKLLSESKYANVDTRPRITVTVPGTGGSANTDLEVIMNMWEEILGVEVAIQQVEWATFLSDLDEKRFQMFAGIGWEADYPDPQDFLDILFHTNSENNQLSYSNYEVDSLLERARIETDVEERIAMYQSAEQLIINDAPLIPLWYPGERYLLIKEKIKNFELTPMIVPKMRFVYIED
jgi:oligopeptide transport system substrate-binding protein